MKLAQKKMAIGGGFSLDMGDFFKFKSKKKTYCFLILKVKVKAYLSLSQVVIWHGLFCFITYAIAQSCQDGS